MTDKGPVITLDGPSGTGKGTMSQLLAKALSWNLLDSGALYRVLALAAKQHAVDFQNEEALEVLAAHLDVQFKADTGQLAQSRIILEGEDVTDAIRTQECGNNASKVASLPKVRKALLERQRAFAEKPGLVTDGRDMGTVVFPNAILKLFLDASLDERGKRRYQQLKDKGISANLAQIVSELKERDKRDRERVVAPLKPAEDAIYIDTTGLSIDQVLSKVLKLAQERIDQHCDTA